MFKSIIILGISVLLWNDTIAQNSGISKEEKKELHKMRKDMNLSEDQKAKLKAIHQERKANKEARKSMSKADRQAANKADKAKVDEVLNPEQEAKRDALVKKRREFKKN